VTDDQGNYLMDNIPVSKSVTLEFAFMGYKTKQVKLALTEPNHHYAHDERLEEQMIALTEVYLTPNGEDPVTYIMRKVQEQSKVNRKRLTDYTGEVKAYLISRDVDLMRELMPGLMWGTVRTTAKAARKGALLDYFTSAPNVKAYYTYTQTKTNGKNSVSQPTLISATPQITDKARKQLDTYEDLFDLLYAEDLKIKPKSAVKDGWKLKGVVEEQGHDVDVLTRTVKSGKETTTYTLYVIEELWTILRYEENSPAGLERYECRDVGEGIYMPVSLITQPIPFDFGDSIEQMSWMIDTLMVVQGVDNVDDLDLSAKGGSLKGRMMLRMARGTLLRAKKLHDSGRTFQPLIDFPFTIKYSNVKVKK